MTVLCMLYGAMMGNYGGLYLPMMIIGYVFSAPFFLLTVRTSQKHGQKKSLVTYTKVALIMYIGVLVLLLLWRQGVPGVNLSLTHINIYTIAFIIFYGIGYGAYYATADMPIPMVADCSDYETYRSGRYIPGIMGTLFSMVDKLVSSLGSTIVGAAVAVIGILRCRTARRPMLREWNGSCGTVLRSAHDRLDRDADCHEGLHTDRKADERDSGSQREAQGRHRRRHEPGRGHGKI